MKIKQAHGGQTMFGYSKKPNGFTLIEVIMAIVIIGVVFGSTMVVYRQVLERRHQNERQLVANQLARQEMERTLQRRFSEVADRNGGQRGSKIAFASPYELYSYETIVEPVSANDLNGAASPGSRYRRVVVEVDDPTGSRTRLTSLVTEHSPVSANCTAAAWTCTAWQPAACSEGTDQTRVCTLADLACANPNDVKPAQTRKCEP